MTEIRLKREVTRLRKLLRTERAKVSDSRIELKAANLRESTLQKTVSFLTRRLQDLGEPVIVLCPSRACRGGFVDETFRSRVFELKSQGRNFSQISRMLGCSIATASLIGRGKYPARAPENTA